MNRVMRYSYEDCYKFTNEMLSHPCVSPFQDPVPEDAWVNLRTIDDNGTIKKIIKYDVSKGIPSVIRDAGFTVLTEAELLALLPAET